MTRSIPIMEPSTTSSTKGLIAIPTMNAGKRNGTRMAAVTTLRKRFKLDIQIPIGYPKSSDATALDTAMSAVVTNSSRLVVKDVRPVLEPLLAIGVDV